MELPELSDLAMEILASPNYLNDEIIGFYFTYLTCITEADDVLFIDPAVSDMLANANDVDVVKDSVEALEFGSKNLIFFAVNDSEHWSLLVYDRKLNEFLHHDSSRGGANSIQAKKLCDALKDSVTSNSADPSVSTCPTFKECVTPEQTNGYDCGLFVLAIARAICEWHCSKKKSKVKYWFEEKQVNPAIVENSMRSEVLKLITDLKRK